ncbi:hypothetical protein QNI16_37365 [Cytophagaceae bacterium YF14B1]|uniref:ATPase AAA-type core domain-containing protein n=1 Tax=Xanthocytophaga flava TaxID=3048013 RepID=A0AAE3UD59_9BACT|nr:hypothetical protein [Xanthocytophaga flavus]MDJ1486213.1 hypothetical protein [Xanthocytophaga flavus]
MELIYLWIKGFRNIREQGFNFSSNYKAHYNSDNHQLNIEDICNPLPNFFGENISSVTAVIGKNGGGKSNILDFIKLNLANYYDSGWVGFSPEIESIVIFNNLIFCHNQLQIENKVDLEKKGYQIINFDECLWENLGKFNREIIERYFLSVSYIFYSNIFDTRREDNLPNLLNVSTNYLVDSFIYYTRHVERDYTFDTLGNKVDTIKFIEHPVDIYRNEEIKRQVNFVSSYRLHLPFKMPEEILLHLDLNDMDQKLRIRIDEKRLQNIRKLDFNWVFRDSELKESEKVKILIAWYFVKSLSAQYQDSFESIDESSIYEAIINQNFALFNKISKGLSDKIDLVERFYKVLDDLAKYTDYPTDLETKKNPFIHLTIKISGDTEFLFFDLMQTCNVITNGCYFIDFVWVNLSSGQSAMFTMFARFFDTFNNQRIDLKNITHIKILIDEGDTYYHPAWQKKFLNDTLSFLSTLYKDKTIQIILTSNSPFIASDIPRSNIIFLNTDKDGNCLVSDLNKKQETFGANIHTLLADSFFLDNGLIGDFANKKIQNIIDWLNSKDSSSFTKDSALALIEMVGEPIIRLKLMEMYDQKIYGDDPVKKLDREIAKLQSERQRMINLQSPPKI